MSRNEMDPSETKDSRFSTLAVVGLIALTAALLLGLGLRSLMPPLLVCGAAGWIGWQQEKQGKGKREKGDRENAASLVPLAEYNKIVEELETADADALAAQAEIDQLKSQLDAQKAQSEEQAQQLIFARQETEQAQQQEQQLTLTVHSAETARESGEAERMELAQRVGSMAEELSGQVVVCLAEAEQGISTAIEAFTRIAGEAQEAATLAQQAVGTQQENSVSGIAIRATDVMEDFIIGMLKSARKIAASAKQLEGLADLSRGLLDLLADVRSVADKTSLVALNASIEAARAGEAGRTFSVVAKEVSKLAETSKDTAERMRVLTDKFSQSTQTIQVDLAATAESSLESSCDAQTEVNRLVQMMQAADQNTKDVLSKLGDCSQNITANYGSIIMAFQFHDLLRQRLEHVAEPLAALSVNLRGGEAEQENVLAYTVGEQAFHARAIGAAPTLDMVS